MKLRRVGRRSAILLSSDLPWGKRHALLVALGYSRLQWTQFYSQQNMSVLIRGRDHAFEILRRVPVKALFDQMKAVIIDDPCSVGRKLQNVKFLRFAAHWGVQSRGCGPYRAKAKGSVETPHPAPPPPRFVTAWSLPLTGYTPLASLWASTGITNRHI